MQTAVRDIACAAVERCSVSAYTIPAQALESDGTLQWDRTTLILVELVSEGLRGTGYTYGSPADAKLIADKLFPEIRGNPVTDISASWSRMMNALRNAGQAGVGAMAVSAVDTALWDLKARLLGMPLVLLFGRCRDGVEVYGSGGFTSYSIGELQKQLGGWTASGIRSVKMKVGREPSEDERRVRAAREAIGASAGLFVDANGAYSRKQALAMAEKFAAHGVSWFEEPVSSENLQAMHLICSRAPAGMDVAAGEYGYRLADFRRMLEADAVDVLQADVTRCGGYTSFLRIAAMCEAFEIPLSSHTAPSLHLPVCLSLENVLHMEYFHDHVRIEKMLFDGFRTPEHGVMKADLSRPGTGLEFKHEDGAKYRVFSDHAPVM